MTSSSKPERARGNHDDDDDHDDNDEYLDLEGLVRYSKLSLRTLQRYLHAADNTLPHLVVRSPGKTSGRGRILVRRRAFDEWMARSFGPQPAAAAAPARGLRRDPADPRWILRAFDK